MSTGPKPIANVVDAALRQRDRARMENLFRRSSKTTTRQLLTAPLRLRTGTIRNVDRPK
jgi:hypothetical protein